MQEHQLYQNMLAGDESAFDALFKMHYKHLVHFAYAKIQDLELSEDIVQNVFIEFWEKRAHWKIEHSVLGYLKTTVQSRYIDYFRKSKITKEKEIQFQNVQKKYAAKSPEEMTISKEFIFSVQQKIEQLPTKTKIVFKLSRYQEMSYQEIADQLGITKKTVEYHISSALTILRTGIFQAIY